jgi:bla regulator protein blaR1
MDMTLESLTTALGWLLRSSWQGALLVLLILVVQAVFSKRLVPKWRYALWGLLIVRLLLVWAPPSPISVYNLATPELPTALYQAPAPELRNETPAVELTPVEPRAAENSALVQEGALPLSTSDLRDKKDVWGFRHAAAASWLVVFLSLVALMAFQSFRFARMVKVGRLVTDSETLTLLEECRAKLQVSTFLAVVETDCVKSPALLGCIRAQAPRAARFPREYFARRNALCLPPRTRPREAG